MSQRKEKYARNIERRTGALEESQAKTGKKLVEYGNRLEEIEETMEHRRIVYAGLRERERSQNERENRRQWREIERAMDRQQMGLMFALALAIIALFMAVHAEGTKREAETIQPTVAATARGEADLLVTAPEEFDPWAYVALYRATEDPLEEERIAEALERWEPVNAWAGE